MATHRRRPNSTDLVESSLLHLDAAAHSVLPASRSLSSHLVSNLYARAEEKDKKLPKSYLDTRVCQRCGNIYIPGVSCIVRTIQSRRQKRKEKGMTWVIYECKACNKHFRIETQLPTVGSSGIHHLTDRQQGKKLDQIIATSNQLGKKRKRERLQGLKNAIEKSRAEKAKPFELDLLDLMKIH